jgi:DNA-binding LacI/PurR family transcriptional regulator
MSTLKDVARIANVSTATVSRVINDPGSVRQETRDRVLRAMKVCDYQYNSLARGFVTKQSKTIGLIVPSITNPIFAESTRGVQDVADRQGYRVVLGNSDYSSEQEAKAIRIFQEFQVDGIIVTTTSPKNSFLVKLAQDNYPLTVLHSTIRTGPSLVLE